MAASGLMNQIFQGEVTAVHPYGAFVKIPGLDRTQGLVHKSQISSSRVDDASEVVEKNDKVWFKVISVSDEGKIGLSMKVVDQGNGVDLDPNNVTISLDAQQRKEKVGRGEATPIILDAILNTTCSKCGIKGHISKSCFQASNSKVYELVPEPETPQKVFGTAEDRLKRLAGYESTSALNIEDSAKKDKCKKQKKEKKKKKKRKRTSSTESEEVKKSKKHKKKQK